METKIVQQALNEFGAMVVQRAQANLKTGSKKFGTHNASGKLSRSLTFKTKINPNSLEFDFFAEDYWKLLDYGTTGSQSSRKAPKSPYKANASTGAIDKWVVRKGLKGTRGKDGRFSSRKSMVDAITRSINKTGTYETKFFRNAFDLEYKNFDEVIAEKYGLDLESFLKYVVNENIKR
tara:strand:+ start:1208 stop:1741 length:534 start_codon:yes stop_codon:yes gene_type:complete